MGHKDEALDAFKKAESAFQRWERSTGCAGRKWCWKGWKGDERGQILQLNTVHYNGLRLSQDLFGRSENAMPKVRV